MKMRCAFVAVVSCLLVAGFAQALTITDNDTGGLVTVNWITENDAVVTGNASDYQVWVGTDNWDPASATSQPQASEWHAVGAALPANDTGYTVNFSYDLFTYDSYVDGGYWDNMGVNLNSTEVLWIQALTDPATTWPGDTFSWGGTSVGPFQTTAGSSAVTGGGDGAAEYVTVFLSTGLSPDADTAVQSWGEFNTDAPPPGSAVPEPATMTLLLAGLAGLAGLRRCRK